jgi:hypothetical protein
MGNTKFSRDGEISNFPEMGTTQFFRDGEHFPEMQDIIVSRLCRISNFPEMGNKKFSRDGEYQVFQRWGNKQLSRNGYYPIFQRRGTFSRDGGHHSFPFKFWNRFNFTTVIKHRCTELRQPY